MSDSQEQPWSNNPNAPKIPRYLYIEEKAYFAGMLVGSILYGALIVLFFQCMVALFNPVNRRRDGTKWGLVSYTVAMFSFATVLTGMTLHIKSISYIDNREFPGVHGVLPPGPHGYQLFIRPTVLSIIPGFFPLLNYWLADGLLLYRCYVIYSRNIWVIAFPCLMYLATMATGILITISQATGWSGFWVSILVDFGLPHTSLSTSLNVLLTLMIVTRLLLHGRSVRVATGSSAGISGLYKAIATMLIESSALYAVSSLILIGLWASGSNAEGAILFIVTQTQVIAPLLIIQRVANRSALTSNTIVTGHVSSFHAGSRWVSMGSGAIAGGDPVVSVNKYGTNHDDRGDGVGGFGATIDLRQDSRI